MKQNCLLLAFLFFAGLHPLFAQTISTQKGLTTASFNLPEGTITVYLPDDIRAGDLVSGTVLAVAGGKNARQTRKNLSALKKYSIEFDGQKLPVAEANGRVQYRANDNKPLQRFLSVINGEGVNAGEVGIKIPAAEAKPPAAACRIPTHALTAAPLRITGPFDGNSSNTTCTFSGKEATVLAESPRQCIIRFPETAGGKQTMQVTENDQQKCTGTVSGVDLHVTTGKLSLRRGERTFIKVEISGLQNLPAAAKLTLTNLSADVVVLQPSDHFIEMLYPDSVNTGRYENNFDVQSMKPGSFMVNVELDLPEPPLVYADNKGVDAGGIKLHPLKVDGLKNGMSDAFKKAVIEVTGNRANNYPELDGCGSCLTCIQSMLDEGKVALVGEIGKILMEHYVDLLVGKAGGALGWIKDKFDKLEKAEDIAGAIADAVTKGEIQVVEFPERMCGYCLVSAIGFYDAKTQCMDAFFYCKGSKMCCSHSLTIIHLKYCVGDDGYKKPDAGLEIDVISR
ncbi:MAG: hypothetical protein IPJ02_16125 [Chitinophagaceae bacterium]|nr:hypothetical protein [Chitinophagaceae bacterium]